MEKQFILFLCLDNAVSFSKGRSLYFKETGGVEY